MKLPPFKIKKLIFIKKRVYLIQLILMVNMKKNILLLNVSKKDLQFIDNNEFIVNEVHNIDKQQNIVKDAQVVLVDLEQKDNFKEMFSKIKKINENIKILGLVNFNRLRVATKLLKENLTDYIIKDDDKTLELINARLGQILNTQKRIEQIKKTSSIDLVTSSIETKQMMDDIIRMSNANISILIQGEEGSEHELYARTIHEMGNRRDGIFLDLFCPSINKDNLEKILYQNNDVSDKFKNLDNGTIFFESIDLLDLETQGILVRILEKNENDINFRVISSTVKDLEKEVQNGNFSKELYFFINSYKFNIPPLRTMRNIIPLLAKNLYKYFSMEQNKEINGITNGALRILENYEWHGNLKEIKNVMKKAVILNTTGILDEDDFLDLKSKNITNDKKHSNNNSNLYTVNLLDDNNNLKNMRELEKEILYKYMKINSGNMTETAKVLNLGRATLYRKIEEYDNE